MAAVEPTIREERRPDGLLLSLPAPRFRKVTPFLILFGGIFAGIPTFMLIVILALGDAPGGLFGSIFLVLFLSVFIAVGAASIWYGLCGRLGSTSLLVRDGGVTVIRRIFLFRLRQKVEIAPTATLRVAAARQKEAALAGLCRIVIDHDATNHRDLLDGIDEHVARTAAERLAEELGVGLAEDSGGAPRDDASSDEASAVVLAPIDRTERRRNVPLESEALYRHWMVTLIVAIVVDSILTTVGVILFVTGVFGGIVPVLVFSGFGLVGGIVTVVAMRHAMIAMRLDPPHVEISVAPLLLGETFQIGYRQTIKAPCRIEEITARLFLRETARYRRGTNTYTVTHEAFESKATLLGETAASAGEQLAASASFRVPTDAMHTFVQSNNRLEWFIQLRVRIKKWPDAAYDFPCVVWPYAFVESTPQESET